ncbi:MAG: hypothetical protein AB1420_10190 [Bacillota bacterium]
MKELKIRNVLPEDLDCIAHIEFAFLLLGSRGGSRGTGLLLSRFNKSSIKVDVIERIVWGISGEQYLFR